MSEPQKRFARDKTTGALVPEDMFDESAKAVLEGATV